MMTAQLHLSHSILNVNELNLGIYIPWFLINNEHKYGTYSSQEEEQCNTITIIINITDPAHYE